MSAHQEETASAARPGPELSLDGTVASVSRHDVYSFTKPTRDEIVLIAGLGVAGDVHAGVTVKHRSRVAADPDQPNLRQVHLIRSELHDELREAGYEVPPGGLGENITTAGIDPLALPVGTILRFGPAPAAKATGAPGRDGQATGAPGRDAGAVEADASSAAKPATAGLTGAAEAATSDPAAANGAAAVVAAATRVTLDASAANAVAALSTRIAAEQSRTHDRSDPRPAIVITGLRNPCRQINDYRPGLLKQVLSREPDGSLSRRAGAMAVVLRGGTIRPGVEIHVELPAPPYLALDRV
jgi:MOSC domain-containing protein YiiM